MKQGYYITGVPINHPDTGLKLMESALFKELKINYPNVSFTKVNILPSLNNPKFASSQLGSTNTFVLLLNTEKSDDIIFNNLPFIISHSHCHIMHKWEKKKFIFCSCCYKIGTYKILSCRLKSAFYKFYTIPSGSSSQYNSHCPSCVLERNLGTECAYPPTCHNCLEAYESNSPLCPE